MKQYSFKFILLAAVLLFYTPTVFCDDVEPNFLLEEYLKSISDPKNKELMEIIPPTEKWGLSQSNKSDRLCIGTISFDFPFEQINQIKLYGSAVIFLNPGIKTTLMHVEKYGYDIFINTAERNYKFCIESGLTIPEMDLWHSENTFYGFARENIKKIEANQRLNDYWKLSQDHPMQWHRKVFSTVPLNPEALKTIKPNELKEYMAYMTEKLGRLLHWDSFMFFEIGRLQGVIYGREKTKYGPGCCEIIIWDTHHKMRQVIIFNHHVNVNMNEIKRLITSLEFQLDAEIGYEKRYNLVLDSLVKIPVFAPTADTICRAIATQCSHNTMIKVIRKTVDLNERIAFNHVVHEDIYYEECTALHIAVSGNDLETVKVLCKYGSGINERTERDETPLHIAVHNDHAEMVEFLLAHGADANLRDVYKFTPLNVVRSETIVKLLKPYTSIETPCLSKDKWKISLAQAEKMALDIVSEQSTFYDTSNPTMRINKEECYYLFIFKPIHSNSDKEYLVEISAIGNGLTYYERDYDN